MSTRLAVLSPTEAEGGEWSVRLDPEVLLPSRDAQLAVTFTPHKELNARARFAHGSPEPSDTGTDAASRPAEAERARSSTPGRRRSAASTRSSPVLAGLPPASP